MIPLAPSPFELLDALYSAGELSPIYSDDCYVAGVLAARGWDADYIRRALEAHRLRRYQAETGLPF